MPIKKIKEYVELAKLGDKSLQERYDIIKAKNKILFGEVWSAFS